MWFDQPAFYANAATTKRLTDARSRYNWTAPICSAVMHHRFPVFHIFHNTAADARPTRRNFRRATDEHSPGVDKITSPGGNSPDDSSSGTFPEIRTTEFRVRRHTLFSGHLTDLEVRHVARWECPAARHSRSVVTGLMWGSCSATPLRVAERLGYISEPCPCTACVCGTPLGNAVTDLIRTLSHTLLHSSVFITQ